MRRSIVTGKVDAAELEQMFADGRVPKYDLPTPFEPKEYQDRIDRLREQLDRRGLDAFVATTQHSWYYLFGYDLVPAVVVYQIVAVPRSGDPVALVRYFDANLARQTGVLADVRTFHESDDPTDATVQLLREVAGPAGRLGIEEQTHAVTHFHLSKLREGAAAAGLTLTDASDLVPALRAVKSPAEIEQMRRAGEVADRTYEAVLGELVPGVRECDVAAAGRYAMHRAGGDDTALPMMLSSGRNTLLWTHLPALRKTIERGDMVMFETSPAWNRYNAVACQTVLCGRAATDDERRAYAEARGILDAIRATLGPGVPAADVGRAAWDAQPAEYPEYLRRMYAGYGIGIGYPSLVTEYMVTPASDFTLQEGMTVAVFGCSARGSRFAIACADPVVITANGFEDLMTRRSADELRVVGV